MAAVVRGGHDRHGGRGCPQGRGAAAAAADPPQVLSPVGHQWEFWKDGNANTPRKATKEEELEIKIYNELKNHPKINQDELNIYGLSAGLLTQVDGIVRMLHRVVAIYNRMGVTRRRYLYKKLHGVWGKEMDLMSKKITSDSERAKSLVDEIRSAQGYCPDVPSVFDELPKLN